MVLVYLLGGHLDELERVRLFAALLAERGVRGRLFPSRVKENTLSC